MRAALESCATAMAIVDRALTLRELNQGLRDWLGGGTRHRRGEALALLDATPPRLTEAAERALTEERRIWLRDGRLRTAIGDRAADLALTPLDADTLLLEVQPVAGELVGLRLSESLRGFAHEVKGPLAGMRGAAQLLQRRVDEAELAELAGLVVGEVDRLAALADSLLETGTKRHARPVNIHELVERVAALVASMPDAPRIRRDYDPSLPPIAADADRLQQACLNLARNAAEAGARTLTVRTRVEHGVRIGGRGLNHALRVDFADDGRGVPAELADTLFEPLVSGRADGTGLGLALAREIAREHGGDLGYASRPGATVFTLLLPLGDAEERLS
ncbi:ATP-binding protein [Dokdonella sp.]|uniref:two-component system sensor histidine kinase NtrB n=1 Tax=Dokdonella sp. TaxID=2291710 RepID=UPI0026366153|nr:ATP-binding protein [Dokdonella sp.]